MVYFVVHIFDKGLTAVDIRDGYMLSHFWYQKPTQCKLSIISSHNKPNFATY